MEANMSMACFAVVDDTVPPTSKDAPPLSQNRRSVLLPLARLFTLTATNDTIKVVPGVRNAKRITISGPVGLQRNGLTPSSKTVQGASHQASPERSMTSGFAERDGQQSNSGYWHSVLFGDGKLGSFTSKDRKKLKRRRTIVQSERNSTLQISEREENKATGQTVTSAASEERENARQSSPSEIKDPQISEADALLTMLQQLTTKLPDRSASAPHIHCGIMPLSAHPVCSKALDAMARPMTAPPTDRGVVSARHIPQPIQVPPLPRNFSRVEINVTQAEVDGKRTDARNTTVFQRSIDFWRALEKRSTSEPKMGNPQVDQPLRTQDLPPEDIPIPSLEDDSMSDYASARTSIDEQTQTPESPGQPSPMDSVMDKTETREKPPVVLVESIDTKQQPHPTSTRVVRPLSWLPIPHEHVDPQKALESSSSSASSKLLENEKESDTTSDSNTLSINKEGVEFSCLQSSEYQNSDKISSFSHRLSKRWFLKARIFTWRRGRGKKASTCMDGIETLGIKGGVLIVDQPTSVQY